ncbi:SurA N-terminal domain-containing protein [Candidatus Avelusimicrobium facis]|uniref:peptidylprolyl isomerase n=1 Tax=Candidatus Avelusimicrobium facis TaxID=3416203 RepID=UPI0015B5637B
MNKTNKFLLCALALCLAGSVQGKVMESSVATVNGRPVLSSEYDNYYEGVIEQYQAAAPQFLEQKHAKDFLGKEVLKELISKELMYQAAEEAKIVVKDSEVDEGINEIKTRFAVDENGKQDPKGADKRFNEALKKQHLTLKSYKAKIKKDIAVKKLMEAQIQASVKPVEEADVKALYANVEAALKNKTKALKALEKEDPAKLQEAQLIAAKLKQLTAEQVRVGHIYLAVTKDMSKEEAQKKADLAKQIKKELDGGMDFSAAVQKYTEDKTALASGGDMILIKGIAPKEIDAAAFTLPVGKVSAPVQSEVGWHIIKVKEKRAEKEIGYDDIAKDLAQYIAQQKIQKAMTDYVNGLADKADIKVTKTFDVDKEIEAAAAQRAAEEAKKEAAKASAEKAK